MILKKIKLRYTIDYTSQWLNGDSILDSLLDLLGEVSSIFGIHKKIDAKIKYENAVEYEVSVSMQSSFLRDCLDYCIGNDTNKAIITLFNFLGFYFYDDPYSRLWNPPIQGLHKIVTLTEGRIGNFKENKNGTCYYFGEKTGSTLVGRQEHICIQSESIRQNYFKIFIVPLKIGHYSAREEHRSSLNPIRYSEEMKSFTTYASHRKCNSSKHIKTLRDVELTQIDFFKMWSASKLKMGADTLWPVYIEDEEFLENIYKKHPDTCQKDVLVCDLDIVKTQYSQYYVINNVSKYIAFHTPFSWCRFTECAPDILLRRGEIDPIRILYQKCP